MKQRGTGRRPLALTAAATIALSGLFVSAPAFAEDEVDQPAEQSVTTSETAAPVATETPAPEASATPTETAAPVDAEPLKAPAETEAPGDDAPPADVVELFEKAEELDIEAVAAGTNAAGEKVIVVTDESAANKAAVNELAADEGVERANVITVNGTLESFAEGDVVGGQGFVTVRGNEAWACSVGFAAWAPGRVPALLSAGHCAFDEDDQKLQNTTLTIPNEEPAEGGSGALPDNPVLLGTYGFAQFGSTNNAEGANGDVNATDISVIELNEAGGWNPLPAVTDWSTAGASLDSLAAGTIAVKAVGAPQAGIDVSKSGRTTGFTTGEIGVLDGWANISGHFVRGFSSDTLAAPGDSGGSVIQGTTAVGVISGGSPADAENEQFTWSTSLVHALPKTSGYEVALDLDAPVVSTPADGADVTPGQSVSGTAPGATSVIVNQGAGDQTVAVSNGAFSFAGPVALGAASISVTSVNGMSRSDATTIAVNVEPAPLVAPVITSPANGSKVTATVTEISGTGLPTADITVVDGEGNPLGTAVVGSTGNWTVTGLDLTYGSHEIVVTQTRGTEVSPEASATFSVVPVAPAVTSIGTGSSFPHDEGPSALSGTGIDGATVTVTLNGAEPTSAMANAFAAASGTFTATVVDGVWSVSFGAPLAPGSYSVSVTQSINSATSAPASVTFAVLAAPAPGGGGGAVAPGDDGTDDGNLAETGVDTIVPLVASAVALALLSGGLLLVVRRRRMIEA